MLKCYTGFGDYMKRFRKRCLKSLFLLLFVVMTIVATELTVYVCTLPVRKNVATPSVCIDPGHGGHDSGATYKGRREKDDVLRLSLLVRDKLEAKGIKVYMTREDDTFKTLEERCAFANKKHCSLFVAIHRNSSEKGKGMEIWVKNTPEKIDYFLAESILNQLNASGHITKARGVKTGYIKNADGNYYVNAHTKMPSCLAEIGFVTSEEDNQLFDKYLEEYAERIALGITETLTKFANETS